MEKYILVFLILAIFLFHNNSGLNFGFSIVDGNPTDYINFSVKMKNTGNIPLTCSIIETTPSILFNYFDTSLIVVPVSSSYTKVSNLIETSQFEDLTQPVRFSVKIRCSYLKGIQKVTLIDQERFLDINIQKENLPCGNGICAPDESTSSCPVDCVVSNPIKFRTSDIGYSSTSFLSFTTNCNQGLTPLIANARGTFQSTTCQSWFNPLPGYGEIYYTVPCNLGNCYFGKRGTFYYVCWESGTNVVYRKYLPTEEYPLELVDKNKIQPTNELSC